MQSTNASASASGTTTEPSATGLSVLVNPDSPSIDIVFIHGFTGHPVRAWTHKGEVCDDPPTPGDGSGERPSKIRKVLPFASSHFNVSGARKTVYWPKDLVPITVPNARVLTYGYDTHIRHRLGSGTSKNTLYDIAWDFLVCLEGERHKHRTRPLLFVAHSLGGIVVKESLRRSRGCAIQQSHLRSIYENTVGILFFGTPHSGADQRLVQNIAEKVAKAVGFMINDQILNSLMPSSERLKELRDDFGPMARQQGWTIYSFQEEYGIPGLNGKKVVEDTASCLNDPSIEIIQHIASNHTDMCRFSGPDDVEYKKIARAFTRVIEVAQKAFLLKSTTALDAAQRTAYLDSLRFDQIDSRQATIKTAHAKTCKWLLKKSEYQDWLDINKISDHHGFLWIKGKPATGKSTIMKFAYINATRTKKDSTIISFFFNARGDLLEKSVLGMFRSLLVQLLEKLPELQSVFDSIGPKFSSIQLDLDIVKDIFSQAIQSLRQRPLACFIDALDECEEDQVRDMVQFFESLGEYTAASGIQFHVCFSSRHYPHITIEKSVQLILEGQEGHQQDIANYVNSELKAGDSKRVEQIKDEILQRASGIFLWVVLVIKMLNKEFDRGRLHALKKRLDEIPNRLEDLFSDILTRDGQNMEELVLCLQWILYAKRPLKCEELYFAILSGVDPDALTPWDSVEITKQDMERFVLNSSKGLADLTKSKNQSVQFIHESVRDFLFSKNGLDTIQSNLSDNFQARSHDRLKQCCQSYMTLNVVEDILPSNIPLPLASSDEGASLRQLALERFPFLEYAVRNFLHHADAASRYGLSQTSFIEHLVLGNWIQLNNLLERYQNRRYTPKICLLYILAEYDVPNLISIELERTSFKDLQGERYGSPLHVAVVRNNQNAIKALLTVNSHSSRQLDHQKAIARMIEDIHKIFYRKHGNILCWAAQYKYREAAIMLLNSIQANLIDVDSKGAEDRTPLSWAASHGWDDVVKLLLETRQVDVNSRSSSNYTPLHLATQGGYETVIKLLLEAPGVNVNSTISRNYTPLCLAAEEGHEAVVKLLLEASGVNVNSTTSDNYTPLYLASLRGHETIVKLLLEAPGVNVNSTTSSNYTPLCLAALRGYETIVKLLLKAPGVNVNSSNYTPLCLAAEKGHEAVVKLLLEAPGVNVSSTTSDNYTPLCLAAEGGYEAVVKLLLEAPGINSFQVKLALSLARSNEQKGIVKLLEEAYGNIVASP